MRLRTSQHRERAIARPRRRPRYASVAATLALLGAIGGGTAYAAHHYRIGSTGQIKPSVLAALRSADGANGGNGTNGSNGTNGTNGTNGANTTTGYSAVLGSPVQFDANHLGASEEETILQKSLPAGHFQVEGDVFLTAESSVFHGIAVSCTLEDSGAYEGDPASSNWTTQTTTTGNAVASGAEPFSFALDSSTPSTVTLECIDYTADYFVSEPGGTDISAEDATIAAVKTTQNG